MRPLKLFLAAFAVMLFTSFTFAQKDAGWLNVDSGQPFLQHSDTAYTTSATKYSKGFNLNDYLTLDWTYAPWTIELNATVPTAGTPKMLLYIQGSFSRDTLFANIDTLVSSDSTYSRYKTKLDFNNYKFPFYRYAYTVTSASADSVVVQTKLFNGRMRR